MEIEYRIKAIKKILGVSIEKKESLIENINDIRHIDNYDSIKDKQIFFELDIGKDNKEIDSLMNEQLQIAFQILINNGYNILVAPFNEESSQASKDFVDIFKSESIKYIEDSNKLNEFYNSEIPIIMTKEYLIYSLVFNKPFISFYNDIELLEKFKIKDFFINKGKFNAGILLKKIKFIEDNREAIKENILNLFDSYKTELLKERNELNNEVDEIEALKKEFKNNIRMLIEDKKIAEVEILISEYENILPTDVEIILFKSEISRMKLED